jgi:tRNA nucleotidyltransferase (CCA-adding enzyme)
VRVLHSISFVDDPTRILRAARLEQRLGFQLEPRTQELIAHALPLLDRVSPDRLRHELDAILREAEPEKALARLAALNALPHIHPALRWDDWLAAKFAEAREPAAAHMLAEAGPVFVYYALLACRLTEGEAEGLLARLRPARQFGDLVRQAAALRARLPELAPGLPPSGVVRILDDYDLPAVRAAWLAADDPAARAALAGYLQFLRHVAPETDGAALKARGLKPGPRFREILAALRAAWLDGVVRDAEGEAALLEALLAERADG